jgi:hypothetical protein
MGTLGSDLGKSARVRRKSRAKTIAKWILGIGIGLGFLVWIITRTGTPDD